MATTNQACFNNSRQTSLNSDPGGNCWRLVSSLYVACDNISMITSIQAFLLGVKCLSVTLTAEQSRPLLFHYSSLWLHARDCKIVAFLVYSNQPCQVFRANGYTMKESQIEEVCWLLWVNTTWYFISDFFEDLLWITLGYVKCHCLEPHWMQTDSKKAVLCDVFNWCTQERNV